MKVCLRCQRTYGDAAPGFCENDGGELRAVLAEYVPEEAALVGRALAGRYVIDKLLGVGGMGIVVRARHVFLDRLVAVKLLHPQLLMVREVRERFLREAQTAARLRHPNVVEITDSGVTQEGLHYLVMEYLEGENLQDWVTRVGRVDPRVAADVGGQVCSALTIIHESGFIHRDLKPENIWVMAGTDALRVKVLDFGIAGLAATEDEPAEKKLTRTGSTVGTPHYMSPEQGQGIRLDGRTDLYALGCILFEIVTGELAFPGNNAIDILTRQLLQPPRAPSTVRVGVPAWFDQVVLKCLCKSPNGRYADAAELGCALQAGADLPADAMPLTSEFVVESPDALASTAVGLPTLAAPAITAATGATRETTPVATAAQLATVVKPRRTGVWSAASVVLLAGGGFAVWKATATAPAPAALVAERPALLAPAAVAPAAVQAETVTEARGAEMEEGTPQRRPPEPTPAAAAPAQKVKLHFTTQPRGTEVYIAGDFKGTTPTDVEVDQSDARLRYELRAPGYVTLTGDVLCVAEWTAPDALAREPVVKVRAKATRPKTYEAPSGLAQPQN